MKINKLLLLNKKKSDYNKNFTNIFVDDSIQPERFSFLKKSTLEYKLVSFNTFGLGPTKDICPIKTLNN